MGVKGIAVSSGSACTSARASRVTRASAVSANLKYLLAVLAAGGKWDPSIARERREAGLAR